MEQKKYKNNNILNMIGTHTHKLVNEEKETNERKIKLN